MCHECMYTKSSSNCCLLLGVLINLRFFTARRSSCSSHSGALPAWQQPSGPDISMLRSELQSQWDHDKNAHLSSVVIKPQSNRRVYWICTNCPDGRPHMWQASVQKRTLGRGCPFCSGQKVCPHNSLPSTAPKVATDWDTAKNPGSPHDYTANSHHQAHWLCDKCGHEWQTSISNRVAKGNGCPYCVSKRQRRRLPTVTASSSSMKQYWDSQRNAEQGLDPDSITVGSNRRASFVCDKCPKSQPHTWTARVTDMLSGGGCPCCSGHRVCKCNSLQTLRPDLAAQWYYAMNEGTPADYTAKSHMEVWWQNGKRGRWKQSIKRRSQDTLMPEVKLVLNKFVQCWQVASGCLGSIHALISSPAAVALCARTNSST